jgi:RNA polymerase sigma-70 factor (ECF subfamily)
MQPNMLAFKEFQRSAQTGSRASRSRPDAAERRLLDAARDGDRRALSRLLGLVSKPIYRFSRGFCRDAHDAEDVVQDVLVSLVRALRQFRGDASLSTWAYAIARRACMRQRRRRAHAPRHIESLEHATDSRELALASGGDHDPVVRHERRELRAALERAIGALPSGLREALVLRDVEGLSAREAGRVLGIGERALKSRLHRARLLLRDTLAPHFTPRSRRAPPRRPPIVATHGRCPDTTRSISRFLEGELSPAACESLRTHVASCADCGEACESLRRVLGECRAWGRQQLPPEIGERVRAEIRRVLND